MILFLLPSCRHFLLPLPSLPLLLPLLPLPFLIQTAYILLPFLPLLLPLPALKWRKEGRRNKSMVGFRVDEGGNREW